MRLRRSSLLPCPVDVLARELARPELLNDVSWPMLNFVAVEPDRFPARWEQHPYRTRLLVGGKLSIGEHTLDLQRAPGDGPGEVWHDAGYSGLIRVWDHRIELEDVHGMTRYTDVVEVRAGLLTLAAWLFAQAFYAHRQRRLARFVAAGFEPLGSLA